MSGHSKWAQIKRQKGVADTRRGAAFTKLANAVTVAAREGGDPGTNFKLRLAVDRARAANMPKENIERAIKRGTGELAGAVLEAVAYEGFGPGRAAVVAEALTDNRNRTAQAIKAAFQRSGGSLGAPGSVAWMFDRRGVIRVVRPPDYGPAAELALIELGADDIVDEGDAVVVLTAPEELAGVRAELAAAGWTVGSSDVELWPKIPGVFPDGREGEQLAALLEALEGNEEVQHVATSAVR